MNSHYRIDLKYLAIWICIIAFLALLSSAAIAAEEQIKVWSTAETKVITEKDGKKVEKKIAATKLPAGKTVYYKTFFKNIKANLRSSILI